MTNTIQEQMKSKLESAGIPFKEVRCYGSQIMITAWSDKAARRWASLLAKFATVNAMRETIENAKENKGTNLCPTMVKVWLVWATI